MTRLILRCACGQVEFGVRDVHAATANRVVCECEGCRAFAHRMGHAEILDEHGGTERFQVSPATVRIAQGATQIACLQQTHRGALRWYARCCATPLALTLPDSSVPFVGLDAARIVDPPDGVLGPLRARVNSRLRGDQAIQLRARARDVIAMLVHLIPLTLRWWWAGDHLRSPFVQAGTTAPVIEPERLYANAPARPLGSGCR